MFIVYPSGVYLRVWGATWVRFNEKENSYDLYSKEPGKRGCKWLACVPVSSGATIVISEEFEAPKKARDSL